MSKKKSLIKSFRKKLGGLGFKKHKNKILGTVILLGFVALFSVLGTKILVSLNLDIRLILITAFSVVLLLLLLIEVKSKIKKK